MPQTILEIKNDTIRTELLNKLDEVLNKAIEDKNVTVITYALKELNLLYREYSNQQGEEAKRILAEYFDSYQAFTSI